METRILLISISVILTGFWALPFPRITQGLGSSILAHFCCELTVVYKKTGLKVRVNGSLDSFHCI